MSPLPAASGTRRPPARVTAARPPVTAARPALPVAPPPAANGPRPPRPALPDPAAGPSYAPPGYPDPLSAGANGELGVPGDQRDLALLPVATAAPPTPATGPRLTPAATGTRPIRGRTGTRPSREGLGGDPEGRADTHGDAGPATATTAARTTLRGPLRQARRRPLLNSPLPAPGHQTTVRTEHALPGGAVTGTAPPGACWVLCLKGTPSATRRACLRGALAGRPLTRSDFRVPRFAVTDLAGRVVTEVRRARQAPAAPDGPRPDRAYAPQDGRPVADRARVRAAAGELPDPPHPGQRGVAGGRLPARDRRGAADCRGRTVTGHLGPDLLGPDWDQAEAVRRLRVDPERSAGEALLDQRNLAGIGNVYKSEVLFLRGIRPWRPVGKINDRRRAGQPEPPDAAGSTRTGLTRVTTGDERRGHETWVYGRRDRPCRRCGTRIRRAELGDRVTYWCPHASRTEHHRTGRAAAAFARSANRSPARTKIN